MTLHITSLSKAYGALRVLDDASFDVPDASLTGLIGPNGAGKSTLFSVITGFLAPDSGDIIFGGRSIRSWSPSARARAGMVRTFQVPREFTHLTVRQNLMVAPPNQPGESLGQLFFRSGAVSRAEAALRAQVDEVIALLNLSGVADTPSGRLSGGQKKLLELGRALLTGARLILLDEPFAGVNPALITQIADCIRLLNKNGIGFLIIEHDLAALSQLVTTLHVMDRGCLIASGEPGVVLNKPEVREAYLGGLS